MEKKNRGKTEEIKKFGKWVWGPLRHEVQDNMVSHNADEISILR
jgi:hypothetical protein